MATFLFYNSLAYGLPLAFLVVTPFGIFGLVLLSLLFAAIFLDKGKRSYGWKGAFKFLKQIFGDELDSPQHGVYVLYGIKVPKWKLIVMFASMLCIYFCTLVSFWSDFVFRESDECDDDLDCFAFDASSGLVQQEPLGDNCTVFEDNAGFRIQCYEIAFDYITAIGNSGSVIVIGVLVMTVQSFLSAGVVHLRNHNGDSTLKRNLITILIIIYYTFSATAVFLIPLLIAISSSVRTAIWNTDASYVQYFSYYFTFLIAYVSSGPLFIFKWTVCNCGKHDVFESAIEEESSTGKQ